MRTAAVALLGLLGTLSPDFRSSASDLERIRDEALNRSQVQSLYATIVDQFGPRLTGTPAHKHAAEWARDRLREFGLESAALEPWQFGRGWVLDHLTVEMVEPRYAPLIGYADAWSPSTKGDIIATPILLDKLAVRKR